MKLPSGPAAGTIGLILCRLVVPLSILTGAVFKLVERTPKLLPPTVFDIGVRKAGLDPYLFLATLIALEFVAVAVMLFVSRFARAMAIFMTSSFCVILLAELATGNFKHCGCLGAASPPPWLMLAIDGLLLIGVILFRPAAGVAGERGRANRPALAAAGLVMLLGSAVSFARVLPEGAAPPPVVVDGDGGDGGNDGAGGVTEDPLPTIWYTDDTNNPTTWIGQRWQDLDLVGYITEPPSNMDAPVRYIVFYGRTCDHCEDMFNFDLTDAALGELTTAVEVPVSKTTLHNDDEAWLMPETSVEHRQLPIGPEWYMTTPVTITVENGVVTCAGGG